MEEKMRTRNLLSLIAIIALVMLGTSSYAEGQPAAVYGSGANQFSLATGSPGELGLLKALAEAFGKQDNARMAWFKAGSGESL
jgi:tungstate transport system substrate-binding protein